MLIRAADALASVVTDAELNPNYIVPSVFAPDIVKTVAAAIVARP
jgi:malate dehydrogenase (oxaloacetate-decarboxylating)